MKNIISITNVVSSTLILIASVHIAWSAGPHNFTDGEGNDAWFTGTVSCVACHTPLGDIHSEPFWDPEYDVAILPVFNTEMLEEKDGIPYGPTKLCVSCHDSTIANDMSIVYGILHGGNHSVGIVYDDNLAANNPRLKSPDGIDLPLYDERLECTTCHDPHSEEPGLLRVDNSGSKLCFQCHDA